MHADEPRTCADLPVAGGFWRVGGALVGLFGGGWVGSELGQVADFLASRASEDSVPYATPHTQALAHSVVAAGPAGLLGGIIGFLVTVACLGKGRTVSAPFIGLAAAGAAGAMTGLISGLN